MPLLAIDTSAAISVALLDDDGAVLATETRNEKRRHSEDLIPLVTQLCEQSGKQAKDITAIAVGIGPGPYTGLRVGLMTAEALGFALDVPVYGVGSLETLAQQAAQTLNLPEGSEVVATLDARRKEIYWARYWVKKTAGLLQMEEVQPPQVGAPVVLNEELSENDATFIIGEGAKMYQLVQPDLPDELRHPNAAVLGQIALARAAAGKTQPTTPLYLRRPDVNVKTPPAASN